MENQKLERMPLPGNFRNGEQTVKRIRKLIHTARELGGTVFDVAVESGLFSAEHFIRLQLDQTVSPEPFLSEDMTVVTECYVEFDGEEKPDRIFLYSQEAQKDVCLKTFGRIGDRKLILPFDALPKLHTKGYRCYYAKRADEKSGEREARYRAVFGRDCQIFPMDNFWGQYTFIGSGFQQALVVRTDFAPVIVMPDIRAVEESVKMYHAENLIREETETDFRIERIGAGDEKVLAALESVSPESYETLPDGYRRLFYQKAYLSVYYPEVYEKVLAEEFEADDERSPRILEENRVTLGITFQDDRRAYAVCVQKDGTVKRVPGLGDPEEPLCNKYQFYGTGSLSNAGAAASRMALRMKEISQCAEMLLDVNVEKVRVTVELYGRELPTKERIALRMNQLRRAAKRLNREKGTSDLIAYEQIADLEPDGEALIHWAAEQAGIKDFAYLKAEDAVLNALKDTGAGRKIKENEILLLCEFDEKLLSLRLYRMRDKKAEQIVAKREIHPEEGLCQIEGTDWEGGIVYLLGQDMSRFMLEEGLRALVTGESEADKAALRELEDGVFLVKRQLKRADSATLVFDNGYLRVMKEYPIGRLEALFSPVLEKIEKLFTELLQESGIGKEEISVVFLAGEETDYPFVRKRIEEMTGKSAYGVNATECIAARGAALG